MKILAISDEECPSLWDFYTPGKLAGYDLIISCGDLNASYLSFLVTMANRPLLYVHGNHDTDYDVRPPEGCDCIDDQFVVYNGIRILGLGGCRKYHPGPYHYTEDEMRKRIRKLRFQLWRHKGVDIVVTHCPPEGLGDRDDYAHRGFQALLDLIDEYHPQYLIHGHIHMRYGQNPQRVIQHDGTQIVNACERYTLEIPDVPVEPKHQNQLIFKTHGRKSR